MNTKIRHILKALTWRLIGTLDTFIIAYVVSNNISIGFQLSAVDFLLKFIFYYLHERIWFFSKISKAKSRHLYKTLTWRVFASLTTLLVTFALTGNPLAGFKISIGETITKTLLYYFHEKIWYKINFGLEKRQLRHE